MRCRSPFELAIARTLLRLSRLRPDSLSWAVAALLLWGLAAPPACVGPSRGLGTPDEKHARCEGTTDLAHDVDLELCGCSDAAVVVAQSYPAAPVIASAAAAAWSADSTLGMRNRMPEFTTSALGPPVNPPLLI